MGTRAISMIAAAALLAVPALGQRRPARFNFQQQQNQAQRQANRQTQQAARKQQRQMQQQGQRPVPPGQQRAVPGGTPRPNAPGPHQGDWLRNHQNLAPQQQEQALRDDPGFRRQSPERQQQLLRQLQQFNNRPPEQRQQMLQRMETWERLTPDQRTQARQVWDRFRDLPDDRRTQVHRAYQRLMNMPPEARMRVMGSEHFRAMFSEQEREIITGSLNFGIPAGRMQPDQTEPPPRLQQVPRPPQEEPEIPQIP